MSRTRRTGPVEGFWTTVDSWADDVVEPSPVRAFWKCRARLRASSGPYLDVTGDLADLPSPHRPLRSAVAASGVPLADSLELRSALSEAGIEFRVVTEARRYRWNGPAMTPVVLEVHSTEDEGVLEAWWEDVWSAWPTVRLGREDDSGRGSRRATATAQITRLFKALGMEGLKRPE